MLPYEFKVRGKHKDTNRYRTVQITAVSENKCRQKALEKGLIEPLEVEQLPPREPTERQRAYALSSGIQIPDGATFYDVSALLDRIENNDNSDPRPELIEYADSKEMIFSKYIGKKALYNLIFYCLDGTEKIAFFLLCVYRWLSDDRYANLNDHKYRDRFFKLAEELALDSSFVKSMNRYSGEEIRFFGEIRRPNGECYNGGSVNTIAYKKAAELICREFGLKNRTVKYLSDNRNERRKATSNKNKLFCILRKLAIIMWSIFIFITVITLLIKK